MRKIIVDTIQSPTGTAFAPFESTSTGGIVFKDSADGVYKDATFPADVKEIRKRESGTSAQYIEIPLQDSQGNVKDGLYLHLVYNYLNQIQDPTYSTEPDKRALKLYVKDSEGNTLTSSSNHNVSNMKYNTGSNRSGNDYTTQNFALIRGGESQGANSASLNMWTDVYITLFQDSNSYWHFMADYFGMKDTQNIETGHASRIYGNSYMQFQSGTPHTLVIETNATVGNRENALSVWNNKGYVDE